MKVYAVCRACDDIYYGYVKPDKIFWTLEKAQAYAKELYDEEYLSAVIEYEVEGGEQ